MEPEINLNEHFLGIESLSPDGLECFLTEELSDCLHLITKLKKSCLSPSSQSFNDIDFDALEKLFENIYSVYILTHSISEKVMDLADWLTNLGKAIYFLDMSPGRSKYYKKTDFNNYVKRGSKLYLQVLFDRIAITGFNYLPEDFRQKLTDIILEDPVFDLLQYIKKVWNLDKSEYGGLVKDIILHWTEKRFKGEIEKLNKDHAITYYGGKCRVLRESIDPETEKLRIDFTPIRDFYDYHAKDKIKTILPDGKVIEMSLAGTWHHHPDCRTYKDTVLIPGERGTIPATPGYYNLWKGFSVKPEKGNCDLFLDLIYTDFVNEDGDLYKYLISWMASIVQYPNQPGHVAVVLRGGREVGKGVFAIRFGRLFGACFKHVSNPEHLTGKHNRHLRNTLILFCDEAYWGGDRKSEGSLKRLITEPEMNIEPKFVDMFDAKNRLHLIIASNEDWVVPAGLDERRFFILNVSDRHQKDFGYFKRITNQMDKEGGKEALLDYLLNYDIQDFNIRDVPMTVGLLEQKYLSMKTEVKWWFDKLWSGIQLDRFEEWSLKPIARKDLYDDYLQYAQNLGEKYKISSTSLGISLHKWVRNLKDDERIYNPDTKRSDIRTYQFPELDVCRRYFEEKIIKQSVPWPQETGTFKSTPFYARLMPGRGYLTPN